jgi:undecaprenyl-diphosphatase
MTSWEEDTLDRVAARTEGRGVRVARAVTLLGETPVVWAAVAVAASVAGARTRRWSAVAAPIGALALTAATRRALAELIGRKRPPERLWRAHWSGPSCPSRHTTLATAGAGLVAAALAGSGVRRVPPAWPVGAAVGASRLVLGVHWPTDVLAGWAFAAAALAGTRRWRRHCTGRRP